MPGPGGRLIELLADHGIPEREARIYLAACREGPQTAAELARAAALHRVEAYRFIRQLETAGLLRATGHRPMRFAALPAEVLVDRWIRGATDRLRRLEADRDRTLSELQEGVLEVGAEDQRKFAVLDGTDAILRCLVRRIGTAQKEVRASVPGFGLALVIEGGVGRALQEAHDRGVKVRIATEVTLANRSEAKHFSAFTELRHITGVMTSRVWIIDRQGTLAFVSGTESPETPREARIAVWSTSPSFRRLALEQHRTLWSRSVPAEHRLVDLEGHSPPTLPFRADGKDEPFDRLRAIASLGMRVTGVDDFRLDLPDLIDTIARQLGHQVAAEVEGETPNEVARSLAQYYERRAMGRMEIVRARPLTLRVSGCFACVKQSPEIGRMLCPAMLRSVIETRVGTTFEVSKPDPHRHATRGCVFSIRPT